MKQAKGFTLLEMLAALAVFAMITAITYAAVVPAGEGFAMLQEERAALEQAYLAGRRIRMDVSYLTASQDISLNALELKHDNRSGKDFDHLWLLVREAGTPGLSRVHYYLDEEAGFLMRESSMPWVRSAEKALSWKVGWKVGRFASFKVQARNKAGAWQDIWDAKASGTLPGALRVQWKNKNGERELILPILVGLIS